MARKCRTGTGLCQAVPAQESGIDPSDNPRAIEGEGEEAQVAKPISSPTQPTEQMIREHEISHLPYRSWCPSCVRGHRRAVQHKRIDHSQDTIPVISLDYGYLGENLPFLVRDRKSRALFAHLMPHKGVSFSSYPERAVLRDLNGLGYKKVVLKCDQEASSKACGMLLPMGFLEKLHPKRRQGGMATGSLMERRNAEFRRFKV